MKNKQIYIASDHRGVALKSVLGAYLRDKGYDLHDLGPENGSERVNASDFAVKLAGAMRGNEDALGVLICGTGQAMGMTANRYRHLRAAICTNGFLARMARAHNNANVLVLGAEIVGEGLALDCLESFLATDFLQGRYAERCELLTNLGGL